VALLLQRILQAADGVLDLAFNLVALAFGFQLGVTDDLAGRFLDCALGLLGRTTIRSLSMSSCLRLLTPSRAIPALGGRADGRFT
jgi:hypothetical protein